MQDSGLGCNFWEKLQGSWFVLHLCFSSIAVMPGINCYLEYFLDFIKLSNYFSYCKNLGKKNQFTCRQSSPFFPSAAVFLFSLLVGYKMSCYKKQTKEKKKFQ